VNIGSDKVCLEQGRLIIHAVEPMDWAIREFSRVPVYFQDQKYYVRSKREGERPYRVVYELWPWPEDVHEASTKWVVYDETYVGERDKAAAKARRKERLYAVLLPVYPLLGLFWSGFKHRVLVPLGFEPRSITQASIALTFGIFLAEGIFVGWLAGGMLMYLLARPALRPVDWLLFLLLGADSTVRFGQSLQLDVQRWWGFCEWLWPGRS
jgi:hypothetical protein